MTAPRAALHGPHPLSSARKPRWLALALLAIPMLAAADEKLTYECTGYVSAESAESSAIRPITSYYTLYLAGSTGRYFDWDEQQWQPIHVITDSFIQLYAGREISALHATGSATIDRRSGRWMVSYKGGPADISIGGRCVEVALREPLAEH